MQALPQTADTELAITRVRHPLKVRALTVAAVTQLTPHLVRLTLAGDSLADLHTDGFDDHVKLMLPAPGAGPLVFPPMGADGRPAWEGSGLTPPIMRDYTPRRLDRESLTLDIDFALHGSGPASRWAAAAKVGDTVHIGGPRGSMVVPTDLAWQWLIGDEAALPAIARRLEELGPEVDVTVIVETDDGAVPPLNLAGKRQLIVVQRPAAGSADELAAPLVDAVRRLPAPVGRGHAFAAAESHSARLVREVLAGQHGLAKGQIRASSYWRRGASDHHENLDG
jgi:NADPH-dependent ferric siderophore reductase